MSCYYLLFVYNGSESDDIIHRDTHMVRITFYTLLMFSLHMDSAAGINRVLRDLQEQHVHTGHTGVL